MSQIDTTFPRIPCAFFNPFGLLALFISLPSRFIGVFRAGEGAGVESAQGKSSASSKTTPPNFTAPEASIRADPISLTIPLLPYDCTSQTRKSTPPSPGITANKKQPSGLHDRSPTDCDVDPTSIESTGVRRDTGQMMILPSAVPVARYCALVAIQVILG